MKRIMSGLRSAASHPLARGSMIVFAGTMTANAGAYLYHLVVGRIMGPVQYGELAALLSLSYIVSVVAVMIQTVVTKYTAERLAQDAVSDIRELVLGLIKFLLGSGAVSLVALFFFAPHLAAFLHLSAVKVIYFLFTGILLSLIGIVLSSVLQGMQRFKEGMVLQNINALLRLVAGAAAASLGVAASLFANTLAMGLAAVIALIPLRSVLFSGKPASGIPLIPLFKTSVGTFLAVLGISVLNSQDVVVVKHFLPASEAGWYSALATMGKIIFFASYSVTYVLLPIVSDRSARGSATGKLVYIAVGAVCLISLSITAGFFLLPNVAMELLYGTAFLSAAPYLGLFGVFSSLYTVAYTIVIALLGLGKKAVWIILIPAALVQDVALGMFHETLGMVVYVNIIVSAMLVTALLLYYRHAIQNH